MIAPPATAAADAFAMLSRLPGAGSSGWRPLQAVPSALAALRANKGRSLLTTLGIIIGVAAVIAIVALGQGASASVSSQLAGLGTNVLTIQPGLMGIVLGSAVALALPVLAGWSTVLPWNAIAIAFGVSAAIGVFFGIYPARKASQLDPIVALRYE